MVVRESMSLHAMLHKDMNNEVPDSVLNTCAESDKVFVENLLQVAQAELCVLNLASTTVVVEGKKTVVRCVLTGPSPSVSLNTMRALQAYSPARVVEVRCVLQEGSLILVLEINDPSVRLSTTELDIVRITKRHRYL